jgi:site-specific DNA-methyltransferase (adenine-specific)
MKTHEDVMVFYRKVHRYYPQMEAGEPYSRAGAKRTGPNNHKYGFNGHEGVVNTGTRYPKSVLRFPRNFSAQQQVHPTQKPTTLLEWLLKSYTSKSDLTIDITAGSCSLAAAAFTLGRWCICIEREIKYFRVGKAWLTALARGKTWDPAAYRKQHMESI